MTLNKVKPILPFGLFVFMVIAISAGIFVFIWISDKTHDAKYAKDFNALGKHACPDIREKTLQIKLAPSLNRPDEDLLWSETLKDAQKDFQNCLKSAESIYGRDFREDCQKNIDNIINTESHYRVEVRRTILEFEAGRPVFVFPVTNSEEKYKLIESSPRFILQ